MPPPKQQSAKPTRPRGTRAQTRQRLIDATLNLLRTGGESAVTTVSVTRAAGSAQSAFYKHFPNVEACIAQAAGQVTAEIRKAVAAIRQRMYDTGPGAGDDLVQAFLEMFQLVDHHRAVTELFLRYRCDPVAMGGVMHRFGRDMSVDLARQLTAQIKKGGIAHPPADWVQATADSLMEASFAAIDAHLAGRGLSVEASARLLAAFSAAACLGVVQAMPSR
jgi:TetR/AcrR family transcriptional regulator, fatty acid biosynthesis regulator